MHSIRLASTASALAVIVAVGAAVNTSTRSFAIAGAINEQTQP